MQEKVRVRFAPSPTGYLHVGGARSALFNYLFAKKQGGTFILRIEDTDQSRFVEGALKEIYESLRWMGLQWDEGPDVGGEYAPYIQSQRLDIYQSYADELLKTGYAYRCFCAPERIAQVRIEQEKAKLQVGYDRHCRNLSEDQIMEKLDKKLPFVIRLKIPFGRKVVFNDIIRGAIEYNSDILDDLILIKSDKFPTYHMANVVDDHSMKITHVLRGDEWIASTPRHILLYEAFGWKAPEFAHLPIILSPDGGKLSKRKGAASVLDFKRAGFLPEALFNFLALLGWAPGDNREKMNIQELIQAFSLNNVSPKSSVFDEQKLEWMNGLYLSERSSESLIDECNNLWSSKEIQVADFQNAYLLNVITLLKGRSKRVTELADSAIYFLVDPVEYEKKTAGKYFTKDTIPLLELLNEKLSQLEVFQATAIEGAFKKIAEAESVSTGKLIHPTRLAVSGISFGPGLFEMLELIGKDTVLRRIMNAIEYIKKGS